MKSYVTRKTGVNKLTVNRTSSKLLNLCKVGLEVEEGIRSYD